MWTIVCQDTVDRTYILTSDGLPVNNKHQHCPDDYNPTKSPQYPGYNPILLNIQSPGKCNQLSREKTINRCQCWDDPDAGSIRQRLKANNYAGIS